MGERLDATEARRRINAAMHASGRDAQELLPAAREALSALTAEVEALRAAVARVEALRDDLRARHEADERVGHSGGRAHGWAADRITEALEARR